MPTFDSAARSQALGRPIVLYTITTLGSVFRHTTHAADVVFGGNTFTALTIAHDDEQITQDPSGDELVIHLPITHPMVQRFAATGIPEQSVQVVVQEMQSTASSAAQSWSGPGQSLTINGNLAALRVPTATNDALKIQLPVIAAQRTCNHVLFDVGCAPNPGGDLPFGATGIGKGGPVASDFRVTTTVFGVSANGLTLTITTDASELAAGFLQFGKATASSGAAFQPTSFAGEDQTRWILSHVDNELTINVPFVASADEMTACVLLLEAGCDHLMPTCDAKFNNRPNFGGHSQMDPTINPWVPNGLGVIQQV